VNPLLLSASFASELDNVPNLAAALQTFPTTWLFNDGQFTTLGGSDYNLPQGDKFRERQVVDDYSFVQFYLRSLYASSDKFITL